MDEDGDGFTLEDGDCDDQDSSIHPGAQEIPYDGIDEDCSGGDLIDADGDSYTATEAGGDDCNDGNPNTYPGAPEFADGQDNDCNGQIDEGLNTTDDDQDGFSEAEGDCNDLDASIFPEADETPYDGIDQDCSSADLTDVDGDGFDSSAVEGGSDCNDQVASIHPDAIEVCNGIDEDCDGQIDDGAADAPTWYRDNDADDYGDLEQPVLSCNGGSALVTDHSDCDDGHSSVHPGANEVCDGLDNNCNGQLDENVKQSWYSDQDGDGYGDPGSSVLACSAPTGYVGNATDCNDLSFAVHPGALETCNGVDDNCDQQIDEGVESVYYPDVDQDGYGDPEAPVDACSAPTGYVADDTDCDDAEPDAFPTAIEICDGLDNDCNDQIDEGVQTVFYQDADGDGYGNAAVTALACSLPAGYVTDKTDCDDTKSLVHPGASEIGNGIDDNCNGSIDEGISWTSCLALKTAIPSSTNGTYLVDPDGTGPIAALQVYCDMTSDGGGWTLISQGLPTSNTSLSLCSAAGVGTLTFDESSVQGPAKLADATINALWSSQKQLLIKVDVESIAPTRSAWDSVCVVDFKASYSWKGTLNTQQSLSDLDSNKVRCLSGAWGDGTIDSVYGDHGLFCGYSLLDNSTGPDGDVKANYLIYTAITSYNGGTCGATSAGRSWLSTGNWGCNVTKILVR